MPDKLGQSRTPDLIEVVRAAMDKAVDETFVSLPGVVTKYDSTLQKADVKPLLKKAFINKDGSEGLDVLPIITDVPIVFPRAGKFYITFPVIPGDNVLLVFVDRSIDDYTASTGLVDVDPIDFRSHDISDAVAFPGFYPFTKALTGISSTDMEIGNELTQFKILLKPDGTIEISLAEVPTLKVELAGPAAKLTLGDGSQSATIYEALETFWNTFISGVTGYLTTHTHTGVTVGSGTSGPPPPTPPAPTFPTAAKSTKMKIPPA